MSHERWIARVRYINILTWLRGFRVKVLNFESFFCLSFPNETWIQRKQQEVWKFDPESLGAMLEYWYIERGTDRNQTQDLRNTGRTLHPWGYENS